MNNTVYYFTGTGNSLSIARKLSTSIKSCDVVAIKDAMDKNIGQKDIIGVVCPNYSYDVPYLVADFFKKLKREQNYKYLFVTVSAGGDFGFISRKIQKRLKGATLNSVFQHYMPFNFLPFGDITPEEKQKELFLNLDKELVAAVKIINKRESHIDNRFKPFSKYMKFFYAAAYPLIPQLDRVFKVTNECNNCGICKKVCPVDNITIIKEKPRWNHQCQQCFACVHWCPEKAILCGKKSITRGRYQHRDIKLSDMF